MAWIKKDFEEYCSLDTEESVNIVGKLKEQVKGRNLTDLRTFIKKNLKPEDLSMKDAAEEVIPSARRLIKSLRDIGYDFCTAVADLIDNSIEAGTSRVDVLVEYDGDNSYVRISDDGKGMSEEQLKEAMRYGSERTYKEEDLGKFGLGLKTASMSQCQLFSVASRTWPELKIIYSYCWDMGHIEKTNRWEILPPRKEIKTLLYDPLEDHPGTVVLWEQLDRFLGYKHTYGDPARKKLISTCRELEDYLAMVFHKFLAGEALVYALTVSSFRLAAFSFSARTAL